MTAILAKCGIRKTDSTVAVSRVMFHEKLTCRSALGLALIVALILAMLLCAAIAVEILSQIYIAQDAQTPSAAASLDS